MTPRVAVVHPWLVAGGGSEACALWMIRGLQDDYRVTLVTMGRPDLAALDAKYGAGLDPDRVEIRGLALPPGTRTRFDALRAFPLARYCRRHAHEFDVMISAYNAMDFGVPGIQRIADFSFDEDLRRELDPAEGALAAASPLYRASAWRSAYLGLARALAGDRKDAWKRNLTAANSEWTAAVLRDRFGLASEVVYPPVAGNWPLVPWSEREAGFVVMGRLVPEKGIGLVIDILKRVRERRPVHLHIIGRRVGTAYAREIEDLARRNADWVQLEGEMYGREKDAFLARHKYGISGRRAEPFGIAAAEMVRAGQIVWVPDRGGQTEIVADPRLIYAGPDDAARRVLAVLDDPGLEAELRARLERRAGDFAPESFVGGVRRIVRDFLEDGSRHGA
ncbi:MAG TPA: glycosyltransferase family 4 protein [Candidatus Aminicenantes bacterium]|nr:glycosyltransferase family 4 protein [Candidatus Aminicenantes bacterium]HRY64463.1 glycosyltransferase family 4 protein [Candidatus Aminicenantes bacterium]HRZ71376.1 glycosyltransferase family 4 protein [Candidatus Aminicenantes bacterium]